MATVILAACGGGSSKSSTTTTASTAPPTTVSSAQATAAITTVWESFFGPHGTANQVQGVTPALQTAFTRLKGSPLGQGISAKVTSVVVQPDSACQADGVPAPCATVSYNLLKGGAVVLPNATGYATQHNNTWLVAKSTFCSLLALQGGAPAGC
jgi:hypothetical protein